MRKTSDSDRALLTHISDCVERIREYTGGDRDRFATSRLVQDAVARNLQVLAESTQELSDAVKASEPGVPWRAIAGFRNVLTHGYLALDQDVIWSVIELDLPSAGESGVIEKP